MTNTQKTIKYCAIVFAILLIVSIFSGIIQLISSIFFAFSNDSDIIGENRVHELSDLSNIENLNIDIGAAALEIKTGEAFSVESNHKYLKVRVKNGTLVIEDEHRPIRMNSAKGAQVNLTVPEGFSFNRAEIEMGSGNLKVESLCTNKLSMDLGAGETIFENLTVANQTEITTGVGQFSILGGSISELDFSMGIGDVFLKIELLEEGEFDCGIGKAEIVLLGTKEDYSVSVSKGMGSAKVDGEAVSGDKTIGSGSVSIEINGGIGNTLIAFAEKE